MKPPKTSEAQAVAAFMDTLDDDTRRYLHGMVYRVAGVEPPPPPQSKQPSRVTRGNVIALVASGAATRALPAGCDGRSARRKHPGTGIGDTPEETWDAMRAAYEKFDDEPLTDIARRFGVLYSAAHTMRWQWDREYRERGATPLTGNVIAFPQRG